MTVFTCEIEINDCFLFLHFQVVVNQDKTSKQMAALRLEIQKLTMELLEFKQVLLSRSCHSITRASGTSNLYVLQCYACSTVNKHSVYV